MRNCLFIFFLLPLLSQGQEVPAEVQYLEKTVWRLDFLGVGAMNESRVSPKTTIMSQFHFVAATEYHRTSLTPSGQTEGYVAYSINPQLAGAYRYFYNLAQRQMLKKSTRSNSGNYLSGKLLVTFPPVIRQDARGLGLAAIQGTALQLLWGLQRTYAKNLYLNLELGMSLSSRLRSSIDPAVYFTLGYTLPELK